MEKCNTPYIENPVTPHDFAANIGALISDLREISSRADEYVDVPILELAALETWGQTGSQQDWAGRASVSRRISDVRTEIDEIVDRLRTLHDIARASATASPEVVRAIRRAEAFEEERGGVLA